jgi:hypothetical protein
MFKKVMIVAALICLVLAPAVAQGPGSNQNWMGTGSQNGNGSGRGQGNGKMSGTKPRMGSGYGMGSRFDGGMASLLLSLPAEDISPDEEIGLIYMREEEKLARDVYLTLYDTWKLPIFSNIARSEQRHMDAIKVLLDKYGLQDPIADDTVGVFFNPELQTLYFQLVQAGLVSLVEALWIGATIEDLDILDLKKYLSTTDNSDIKVLYQNLMKGSRNHLRSFVSQLNINGASYTAQYLTQEEVDAIIVSPMERGMVDENGDHLYGSTGW